MEKEKGTLPQKKFPLAFIMSLLTDISFGRDSQGSGGARDTMQFLLAGVEGLGTAVSTACRKGILEQHPQLAKVDATGVNPTNFMRWLEEQEAEFGKELSLTQLSPQIIEAVRKEEEENLRALAEARPTSIEELQAIAKRFLGI